MDADEFREFGKMVIEWIANYKENIQDYLPISTAAPGYLAEEIDGNLVVPLQSDLNTSRINPAKYLHTL